MPGSAEHQQLILDAEARIHEESMFKLAKDYLEKMNHADFVSRAWAVYQKDQLVGIRVILRNNESDIFVKGVTAIVPEFRKNKMGRRLVKLSFEYLRSKPDLGFKYYGARMSVGNEPSFRSLHHAATELGLPINDGGIEGLERDFTVFLFPERDTPRSPSLPKNTDEAWKQVTRSEVRAPALRRDVRRYSVFNPEIGFNNFARVWSFFKRS